VDDILLIDDDVELCSMLTEYMGRYGFRTTVVHRGDTGLKAAGVGWIRGAAADQGVVRGKCVAADGTGRRR
jgi:DNA-binding response OmpR family regulator